MLYTVTNLTIVAILGFVLGIAFSRLLSMVSRAGGFREKFSSLVDGNFELDWTVKEILALFSELASQRWYEARAHVRSGIFISLLCAMRLMYVVRFDFELANDSRRVFTRKKHYHGLRSYNQLKKAILRDVPTVQETVDEDSFFSGALITGHNFVSM